MKANKYRSRKKKLISYVILMLLFLIMLLSGNDALDNFIGHSISDESSETIGSLEPGEMAVHYLDVGQGASSLIESEGHYMLIDGGDRSHSSFVVKYLQNQGITSLDYILITHYHADHLNGIIGVLNAFDCQTVICPDYESGTKLYDSFYSAVSEQNAAVIYPSIGDHYTLGSAVFTVIAPVSYDYENENNNSIGIRLANGADSFLFTGDAEAESEEDFCRLKEDLSCDVYAAGHHGSAGSTTWSLLQKALPEYIVISCGKDNSYGHPHEETIEKSEAIGAKVFRTDRQGTIVAFSSGKGIRWNQEPFTDYAED